MEKNTSWKRVGGWYKGLVGGKGHYYHQKIIMPGVLRIIKSGKVADLGCGTGILGRYLKDNVYLGVDLAKNLIEEAKRLDGNPKHKYIIGDITKKLEIGSDFNWVAVILSLQNVKRPFGVVENAKRLLAKNGKLLIVINHPAF